MHRVLEWVTGEPRQGVAALATWAATAAAEFGLADAAAVQTIATRILASPACAAVFDATGLVWAGNEVPIAAGGGGQVLRIDRLVCTAGHEPTWWVLDYKLGDAPHLQAVYRAQLAAYRDAVAALQPGERVRAAFVTGGGDVIELS